MDIHSPFTSGQRDALIAQSLGRASRNIYGDLGPRCPKCSGLGWTLNLGKMSGPAPHDGFPTRCYCEGSGIDLAQIERLDREALWSRIQAIESVLKLPITSQSKLPTIENSRQYWMECIAWATADGTAVANTTSEAILFPNVTVPANYMQDGRSLRLRLAGKYSTLGSGVVAHVYTVRWGGITGTAIAKTGIVTLLISMTNAYFDLELMVQTRANGSSGTMLADGIARVFGGTAPTIGSATGAPAIAPLTAGGQTAPAAVTVDLTADTALSVTMTHGAASASNTATGQHYTIESLN